MRNECFYSTKIYQYKNKIFYVIILNVDGVKKRWRSLRDTFIKMHKAQKLPSGSGGGKKSKWLYYSQMTFLIPYIEFRE